MIKKISVLHVITRLDRGGSAEVVLDLARELAGRGYRVGLAYGRTPDPQEDIGRWAERSGVELFHIPRLVREIAPGDDLRAFFRIRSAVRSFRPDIVHTHTSKAGILGRFAARAAGVRRIVHTPHGHVFYGYFSPGKTRLFVMAERLAAGITNWIVTLTEAGRDDHLRLGIGRPQQYRIIPSGVDLSRFKGADGRALREEFGDGPMIGWAGRLTAVKDCGTFLDAAKLVLEKRPDARIVVAGGGEERETLERQSGDLGIAPRVRFLGDRRNMPEFFHAIDVFVLSSVNEGFGRVIIEAMASGVPVVSTAVGGTVEVIEDGVSGLLVPAQSPELMAQAILRVMDNPDLAGRIRESGLRVAGRYETGSMVEAYEQIYCDLFGDALPSRFRDDTARG